MFKKNEILALVLASLVIGFVTSFKQIQTYEIETLYSFLKASGLALIIVALCVTASKLSALTFGCEAEFRLWTMNRRGFHHAYYFKRPIPTWILIPLLFVFATWGYIKWLALIVFDASHSTRVLKEKDYTESTIPS